MSKCSECSQDRVYMGSSDVLPDCFRVEEVCTLLVIR